MIGIHRVRTADRASPITRFINLGSTHARTPAETRWVRTINIIAGAGFLSNLVYVFAFLVIDPGELVWIIVSDTVWAFACLGVIWANSRGHSRSASWMFLGTAWANILIVTSSFKCLLEQSVDSCCNLRTSSSLQVAPDFRADALLVSVLSFVQGLH